MKQKTSTGTGMMAATTPTSSAVMPMLRPRYTSTPMPHTANPTTMLTSSTARFHWYRGGAAATTGAATTGSKPGAGIGFTSGSLSAGQPADRPSDRLLHDRPGQPAGQQQVGRHGADLGHHDATGEPDPGAVHVGGGPDRLQGEGAGALRLGTAGKFVTQRGHRVGEGAQGLDQPVRYRFLVAQQRNRAAGQHPPVAQRVVDVLGGVQVLRERAAGP